MDYLCGGDCLNNAFLILYIEQTVNFPIDSCALFIVDEFLSHKWLVPQCDTQLNFKNTPKLVFFGRG